ncbi:calmodulin [Elysia marginata]|uniref:Calmodulin n=1 Tax=Elysia marginata TaxID=1093978 RepID=A0AAV4G9G4_9GAST|nr:calmodulin [Elysia marginata]
MVIATRGPISTNASTLSKDKPDINSTFCLFDADGNGKITRGELREVIKALGKPVSERDLDAMLSSVDTDGSGGIEFDEFLPMIAKEFGKKGDVDKHVRETFRAFDANGDGVISAREFRQAVAKMGQNLTDAEVSEFMRSVDKDGDGVITYDGTLVCVINRQALGLGSPSAELFLVNKQTLDAVACVIQRYGLPSTQSLCQATRRSITHIRNFIY